MSSRGRGGQRYPRNANAQARRNMRRRAKRARHDDLVDALAYVARGFLAFQKAMIRAASDVRAFRAAYLGGW